jgi:hypothetical protein
MIERIHELLTKRATSNAKKTTEENGDEQNKIILKKNVFNTKRSTKKKGDSNIARYRKEEKAQKRSSDGQRTAVRAPLSAPASISSRTQFARPLKAAHISAVHPPCESDSTSPQNRKAIAQKYAKGT